MQSVARQGEFTVQNVTRLRGVHGAERHEAEKRFTVQNVTRQKGVCGGSRCRKSRGGREFKMHTGDEEEKDGEGGAVKRRTLARV